MKVYVYNYDTILQSKHAKSFVECINLMRASKVNINNYLNEVTNGIHFVLVDNDTVIGCARYSDINKKLSTQLRLNGVSDKIKFVSSVFVRKEYRGKGYAKKIINEMYKVQPKMLLEVFVDNYAAMMLYLKSKFRAMDSRKYKNTYIMLMSTCETCIKYVT